MKTIIASVQGTSAYSQSKAYEVDKLPGEGFDDYEKRTWRNRMHVNEQGEVYIPPMAVKNALAEAAKFLSIGVPGKGKATYTKNFEAGVMCIEPALLGVKAADVDYERLFVPTDGRRGSGKRVYKCFPLIPPGWQTTFEFLVLDDTVLQSWSGNKEQTVFEYVLNATGSFIGLGRFRPRNNGFYGRFKVTDFAISEMAMAA